jgi:hypothetical protein
MTWCESCQARPANHHVTVTYPDGRQHLLNLCEDCAQQHLPENAQVQPPSPAGHVCEFCNQPATAGSSGLGLTMFWCTDCGIEIGQIIQPFYSRLAETKATADSVMGAKKAWTEAARILRQRLAERHKAS